MRRLRSPYFMISGGLGGAVGFAIMELVSGMVLKGGTAKANIVSMAVYFAGFGLAVGAALGMTEGVIRKDRLRLCYGLAMGLVLGAVGGFIGGAAGQAIQGLVPLRYYHDSYVDIAITLDSSGSMRSCLVFGNDPFGRRKKAARELIDRLSPTDRVAVVDFDEAATLLYPLTVLASGTERRAAKRAVGKVNSSGGTDLSGGLDVAIAELRKNKTQGRPQHVIFLTDGVGDYVPATAASAKEHGITIHTVGLGSGVDARLLSDIAHSTGGKYYPVKRASALTSVFETIFTENLLMAKKENLGGGQRGKLATSPLLLFLVRVLSWAAMGLVIGAGQGVRENTREDLRACSIGGLGGGAIGGAVFCEISRLVAIGSGSMGRLVADIVVGAFIGGSMRIAQERMVEASGKPTTTLMQVLPKKTSLVAIEPDPEASLREEGKHPQEGAE